MFTTLRCSLPKLGAIALLSLPLAACMVGPDYRKPDPTTTAQFRAAPAVAAVAARNASGSPADAARWWTGFNDPVLDHVVARALAQNLDLAGAAARVEQARARLGAREAALLPAGQAGLDAQAGRRSVQTPLGRLLNARPGFDRTGEQYELDVGASWDLDLFGGLRRGEQAASADYQAAGAAQAAVQLAIVSRAVDTYIVIRSLQSRLAVAREQVQTQRRLVDLVALQYSRGIVAELQLRQAEGALAEVEASVPALENGLEAALNALDVLMGAEPGTWRAELEVPAAIPVPPAVTTAGGPASLIRRRPDLIAAERRLASSNAHIGEAIASYYPRLALSGLIGFATAGGGSLLSAGAQQTQISAGLRWRLFDFGRVDAEVAAARGAQAEALAAYRQAVLRATEDVENAFTALVKHEAQAHTLASGEAALTRARAAAQAAWQGGAVSLIEVLDADSRLLRTRDARVQAQAEAARAAVASFSSLGGGWDTDPYAPPAAER